MAGSVTRRGEVGDVDRFLDKLKQTPAPLKKGERRGRLIFAMDATMSRQPSWDRAVSMQAEMFLEAGRIGSLDVQLAYFRGFDECKASRWIADAKALAELMAKVDCRGGNTQIGRILSHVKSEQAKTGVNAVVFIGDACEEAVDGLCSQAGELGLLGTPVFVFQEGDDGRAQKAFQQIASLSGGAYCKLDASSANRLRELLGAVASYAAGGQAALKDYAARHSGAQILLQQLK